MGALNYEPFYIESLADLRMEIDRLALEIPVSESTACLHGAFDMCGRILPNRFCAQPVSGRDSHADGSPGTLTLRRYRRLAEGGFGLLWFEAIGTPGEDLPQGSPVLSRGTIKGFSRFLGDLKSRSGRGTLCIAQLAPGRGLHPQELDDAAIESRLDDLIESALLAAEAGFDGVDFSLCHGSLAESLLSGFQRDGRFGGSLENRARFVLQAVERVRKTVPSLLLCARVNVFHARRDGFGTDREDFRKPDFHEPLELARALHGAGVSVLNVTSSSPNFRAPYDRRPNLPLEDSDDPHEHPLMTLQRQLNGAAALMRAVPGLAVVASGFSWLRHFAPHVAAAGIDAGLFALAGFGRGALAFPDAPKHRVWSQGLSCIRCGACSEMEHGNAGIGCVIRDAAMYGPLYQGFQRMRPSVLREGAARCHFCEAAPCVGADPLRTPVPDMIRAYLNGDGSRAFRILAAANPLPRLVSHLSPSWMESEGACIEKALRGVPVPILDLQTDISWDARLRGERVLQIPEMANGKSVSIVGGGPAGIGAAVRLLESGFHVRIYEKSRALGGMPARVIPAMRAGMPNLEIDELFQPAIDRQRLAIFLNHPVLPGSELEVLRSGCDAVLIAAGLWREKSLGRRGNGVVGGIEFLEMFKAGGIPSVPLRVAVLGGGDSAMDAARIARESGATDVFVVFGGERASMHWHMREDWFATPGVHAMMEWQPIRFEHDAGSLLRGLRIRHASLGSECLLPVGMGIEAMGLLPDTCWGPLLEEIGPEPGETRIPGIFVAGAILNGGTSVTSCIAEGRAAAGKIHAALFP